MAVWNAAFIIAGLLLIALVAEIFLRLANPFLETSVPYRFVDGVGLIREPNAELRYANWHDDNFVVSRANSLGFLDREPISPERASDSCHIAFIGDSFVEARHVPIADKFHVRLEQMAARDLPRLAITTQAYGIRGTGQINQLPFYDEYARQLNPKLVVLVFFLNDFVNNSTALQSLEHGADPDRMPYMSAHRDAHGAVELRPPDAEYERFIFHSPPQLRRKNAWNRLVGVSYFAKWLDMKSVTGNIKSIAKDIKNIWSDSRKPSRIAAWANMIAERPCCASILDGWRPISATHISLGLPFSEERLPPPLEDALEYTAFGIDQFKRRADRDGVNLAILSATWYMGTRGDPQFDRLNAIAKPLGIPLISDYDYIVSQGHDVRDAHFRSDIHWNVTGHRWVAEAVLEWLKENQDVCD